MTTDPALDPLVPAVGPPYATPERLKVQTEAWRFAMEEVLPLANELDPRKEVIPREFLERMGQQGYFGITLPREVGGMGLGVFEYCMIAEELARAWMSVGSIIARSQGTGTGFADPQKRRRLLERSARGTWIGAMALSEPDAGSDLANVQTRAELDGDEWVISGAKRWCGNAEAADFIQVLARVEDPGSDESRSAGLATIIVEKDRDAFPDGLTGHPIDKIGYHGFLTWELEFDGLRVPAANRIDSSDDDSFAETQRWLNIARVHTAARAVGLARAAVEDCIAYSQERVQFEHPIAAATVTPPRAGRAALARRSADDHLRGHQRDPAQDDRRPAAPPLPAGLTSVSGDVAETHIATHEARRVGAPALHPRPACLPYPRMCWPARMACSPLRRVCWRHVPPLRPTHPPVR